MLVPVPGWFDTTAASGFPTSTSITVMQAPGSGPAPAPASWPPCRNLAIGLIRQAGHTKIAATIRKIKHDTAVLLAILGLKNPS